MFNVGDEVVVLGLWEDDDGNTRTHVRRISVISCVTGGSAYIGLNEVYCRDTGESLNPYNRDGKSRIERAKDEHYTAVKAQVSRAEIRSWADKVPRKAASLSDEEAIALAERLRTIGLGGAE